MSKAPTPRQLDEKKLLALQEPLRVNVVKRHGTRTTPITMPPARMDPSLPNGEGYHHEDIRNEVMPIIAKVAGGGLYSVQLSDSQGGTHEYDIWLPPEMYPDKTPPDMVEHARPAAVIPMIPPMAQPQVVQAQPMQAAMGGGGGGWAEYVAPGVPRPPMGAMGVQASLPGYPMASAPVAGTGYVYVDRGPAPAAPALAPVPSADDRVRALEAQIRDLREDRISKENLLARQQEVGALKEEIRELRKIAERPAPPPPARDDDLIRVVTDLVREVKDIKEKSNAESSQNAMMQMFQMMQQQAAQASAENARRADQQEARFQQLMLTLNQRPTGPDPLVLHVIDSSKEAVRTIAEASKERDRTALSIRDVLDMTQKMNDANGAGALLKNVGDAYSSVFSMAKMAAELITNANSSGNTSPAQELLGTALQRAGDVAQNYIQMRRDVSIGESRAREAEARAHATSVMAQSGAISGQAPAQQIAQAAAGAPPTAAGSVPPGQPQVPGAPIVAGPGGAPPAQPRTMTAVQAQMAEQEMKLFGPVLEHVRRLRLAVAKASVSPEQVVQFIYQIYAQVKQRGVEIPAILLFENEQIGQFVDVLLPEGPKEFVQRLGAILYEARKNGGPPMVAQPPAPPAGTAPPAQPHAGGEAEEEEEDDDEDEIPHSN